MADESVLFESIAQVADRFRRKALSPVELTRLALEKIERLDPRLRAFINYGDDCLRWARESEKRHLRGQPRGPLDGVPVSIKDLIDVRGFPTTAGSRVFGPGTTPNQDAPCAARLRRAGALLIGKANLHEFAYGVTNENHHFGAALNPWDETRVSGGSSGGSAVSVAAGMSFGSLGTDTRGSIRIPSACCGVTGLKPTIGRVSTEGVVPLSWSLDHVGPIARSVEDVALIYDVLAPSRGRRQVAISRPADGLRLGICRRYFERIDPEIETAVNHAIELLESTGLKTRAIEIGLWDETLLASGVIASTEALAFHEPFLKNGGEGYDPAVLQRLRKGLSLTGVDAAKAYRVRTLVEAEFEKAFRVCDCLIGPTVPAPPPRKGEDFVEIGPSRAAVVENMVRLCTPQNMAGVPALTLPCGFRKDGLPIGLQLIAGRRREGLLLELGHFFQSLTDWHLRRPGV